jgi:cobalt/nickel transport system permease protein
MRIAAQSRGGGNLKAARRAASGALAVLFARSYERAESVHRAMLARGFSGGFRVMSPPRFGWQDAVFLTLSMAAIGILGTVTGGMW